jgi:alanyl-tRNA synthetase
VVKALGDRFKAQPEEIVERVTGLQEELKASQKSLAAARAELALAKAAALVGQAEAVGEAVGQTAGAGTADQPFQLLVQRLDGVEGAGLQTAAQQLQERLGQGAAVVLGGLPDPADLGKVVLVAAFGKELIARGQQAGKFIGAIAKLCGGGGGGRPNLAQAGGRDGSALDGALAQAKTELKQSLN